MADEDIVFIDISSSKLTVSETMKEVERIQAEHPYYEIFLDGDAYAIVGRLRK